MDRLSLGYTYEYDLELSSLDIFCRALGNQTQCSMLQIEVAHRKGESVPPGWGTDSVGKVCTDPGEILDTGGLLPLGGAENTSKWCTSF